MKTLQEVYDIIDTINEDAHQQAWDTWVSADELMESNEEADWETAEEIREDASMEQASYFRDMYYELDEIDQDSIKYWLKEDDDFKESFSMYFGESQFDEEFDDD